MDEIRALNVGTLSDTGALSLIALWTFCWVVVHFVAWPCWQALRGLPSSSSQPILDKYRRRLCRSQVYCGICVVGCIALLWRCKNLPHDLLYDFSFGHQVLFTMATGHWIVSIWEDVQTSTYLKAGLAEYDLGIPNRAQPVQVSVFLLRAYIAHHVTAAVGFAVITFSQTCTAVGSFGLLYELPVLFLNHREFVVIADPTPAWWEKEAQVLFFWNRLTTAFLVGRGVPTLVYLYSLLFWQDSLAELKAYQAITYHGMAIFFTALNFNYFTVFMKAWRKLDFAQIGRRALQEGNGGDDHDVEQQRVVIDQSVEPLMRVPPLYMEEQDGNGTSKQLWVELDGVAYDVTEFQEQHPGGAAILKKFGGKDASEAFHKVRHSHKAKIQMQRYAVGPISRRLDHYRIFEHPDELLHTFLEAGTCAMGCMWMFVGWSFTFLLDMPEPRKGVIRAALPALGTTALSGMGVFFMLVVSMNLRVLQPSCVMFGWAVATNLYFAGSMLATQSLPDELAATACPTGFEIGAVVLWMVEEILQGAIEPVSLAAAVMMGISWHLRGIQGLATLAPEHIIAAICIAASMAWITRRAAARGVKTREHRLDIVEEFLTGMVAAGVLGGCILVMALTPDEKAEVMKSVWDHSWLQLTFSGVMSQYGPLGLGTMLNTAFMFSPQWVVRLYALLYVLAVLFRGGFSSWRWLFVVSCLTHMTSLASRCRACLARASEDGTFDSVPPYVVGTQAMWDQFRTVSCTILWRQIILRVAAFVHYILPPELTVFAMPIPVFDLGPGVDLGVAAHFMPHAKKEGYGKELDGDKPGYVVCNVGHIDNTHPAGLSDMQRTMNTLRDVWGEFKQPGSNGLISNVVCVFPQIEGSTFAKEINLSTWRSSKEAYDWYVQSKGHKDVMTQHTCGYLRTFGNLLASLVPVREVRHQDRCTRCGRLVESETMGERAPNWCTFCGARTFGYTYI